MEVEVRGGDIEKAIRELSRRLRRDGCLLDFKDRDRYGGCSPGERSRRKRYRALKRKKRNDKRAAKQRLACQRKFAGPSNRPLR